jgi:hypothetical protein
MGETATRKQLIAQWTELVNDPSLHDLPYKIELTAEGKIQMSPASNWHGKAQARLARALGNSLPGGEVITECSVLTGIGVRVPDVAWASNEFLRVEVTARPYASTRDLRRYRFALEPQGRDRREDRGLPRRRREGSLDREHRGTRRVPWAGRPAAAERVRGEDRASSTA